MGVRNCGPLLSSSPRQLSSSPCQLPFLLHPNPAVFPKQGQSQEKRKLRPARGKLGFVSGAGCVLGCRVACPLPGTGIAFSAPCTQGWGWTSGSFAAGCGEPDLPALASAFGEVSLGAAGMLSGVCLGSSRDTLPEGVLGSQVLVRAADGAGERAVWAGLWAGAEGLGCC